MNDAVERQRAAFQAAVDRYTLEAMEAPKPPPNHPAVRKTTGGNVAAVLVFFHLGIIAVYAWLLWR